jgi:hypothetical protein
MNTVINQRIADYVSPEQNVAAQAHTLHAEKQVNSEVCIFIFTFLNMRWEDKIF